MKRRLIVLISCMCISTLCYGGWGAETKLTDASDSASYGSYNGAWTIAVNDPNVHVVFEHRLTSATVGKIYYKRSLDKGMNWEAHKKITTGATVHAHIPSIAVRGNNIHVVWEDRRDTRSDIYHVGSVDNGEGWGSEQRIPTGISGDAYDPSIAIGSNDTIHVVWIDTRFERRVWYKRSRNNGASWTTETELSKSNSAYYPSVAAWGSNVHIVWQEGKDGNYEIYYIRSTNHGGTWGSETRLTNNTAASRLPSIAVSGDTLHLVWDDERNGNREIYYRRSSNNGTSWDILDTRLTFNDSISRGANIAVHDSVVHIVWEDKRTGAYEVYYTRSENNGVSWEESTQLSNMSVNSATDIRSSIAVYKCDSDTDVDVHVVWTDWRDYGSNWQIYYRRHTCIPASIEEYGDTRHTHRLQLLPGGKILLSIEKPVNKMRLVIYDITGRLAEIIHQGKLGIGTYTFTPNALQQGVYFVKFSRKISEAVSGGKPENYEEIKKLIIIK